MKIVLFGRNGQVGRALSPLLMQLGEVVALGRSEADLDDPRAPAAIIRREEPDIVINAAAYTAVDAAEDDRDRAFRVNAEAVAEMGAAARSITAIVVHYSTDFVFDGTSERPYVESDAARPLSVYGESKLAGERALQASGATHLILRTSWNFSDRGKSFPLSILDLARTRESLNVVADEFGAATPATLIASSTIAALRQLLANRGLGGLYHLTADGAASRHELAQFIVTAARAAGADLALGPEAIRPVTAASYGAKAKRPQNSRLDTARFRSSFGLSLPSWQDGIRQLIRSLHNEGRL